MNKAYRVQYLYRSIRARRNLRRINTLRKRKKHYSTDIIELASPRVLSLRSKYYRRKLLTFISKVRLSCRNSAKKVVLNFSTVENLSSDATLLLWAELSDIRLAKPKLNIKVRQPNL